MPRISVIIPCYNQGRFVDEAVNSVLAQTCPDYEIIIVNDGSTEPYTVDKLSRYDRPRTRVLHTPNQGLAAARNHGIQAAEGEFILPLDADDRIAPTYMEKALAVFGERPDAGIVYCKAELFGDRQGEWGVPDFAFPDVLFSPRIFASGFYRKRDWAASGGYCPEMKYGWEDYEFWLSLIERGCKVYRLPEVLFFYRQRPDSLGRGMTREQYVYSFGKIVERHRDIYIRNMPEMLHAAFAQSLALAHVRAPEIPPGYTAELQAMRETLSWRITSPLRRLKPLMEQCRRVLRRTFLRTRPRLQTCLDSPSRRRMPVFDEEVDVSGWCFDEQGYPAREVRARIGSRVIVCGPVERPDVASRFRPGYDLPADTGFAARFRAGAGPRFLRIEADTYDNATVCLTRRLIWVRRDWRRRTYGGWLRRQEALNRECAAERAERLKALASRPLISVILPVYNTPEAFLRGALDSVAGQTWENWEVCAADDASTEPHVRTVLREYESRDGRFRVVCRPRNGHIAEASNSALEMARGEFIVLLDHDDVLYPDALSSIAEAVGCRPDADLFYSDEDKISADGFRSEPAFKPAFNHDLLLTYDYIGHMVALRTSIVRDIGGFRSECVGSQDWDLLVRLVERTRHDSIVHIPRVLYGWRKHAHSTSTRLDAKPYAAQAWLRVLSDHLARKGIPGTVSPGLFHGSMRIKYPAPDGQSLSLIISADTLDSAMDCVRRIQKAARQRMAIADFWVIGLKQGAAREALKDVASDLRIVGQPWMSREARAALAIRKSRGDVALVLDADGADLNESSLDELVSQACREKIGIVAPLLLLRGGTEQAPVCAIDGRGRIHVLLTGRGSKDPGYMGRLRCVQNSPVLAAPVFCARTDVLLDLLGGDQVFDDGVPLSVIFSYKSWFKGYRNVYTPYASLGMPTRRADPHPFDTRGLMDEAVCGEERFSDPAYNPVLGFGRDLWKPVNPSRTFRCFEPCVRNPYARTTRLTSPLNRSSLRDMAAASPGEGGDAKPPAAVNVVIPVYDGREETMACLNSVLSACQRTQMEVVVINDASPNAQLAAELEQAAARGKITLVTNPANLGFTVSVNRGLLLHEDRDVVLLNSDTLVNGDWLDRLVAGACQAPDIGTVTPLSNNATICSYPRVGWDNPMPSTGDLAALDEICRSANRGEVVDIPTAVGFCMLIRRACLRDIGVMDEATFGKGYGEESDFCSRASLKGWRNVAVPNVFVAHRGCVSFGKSRAERIEVADAALRRLHGDYFQAVARFCRADPLSACRKRIRKGLLTRKGRLNCLCILHEWGGGVEKYVGDLALLLRECGTIVRLKPRGRRGLLDLAILPEAVATGPELRKGRSFEEVVEELRGLSLAQIHYHHFVGLRKEIFTLPQVLRLPYDVTIHDYFTICPQINLIDYRDRYCGLPDEAQCNRCIRHQPRFGAHDIGRWRGRYLTLLMEARRVIVPSHVAGEIMLRVFPVLKSRLIVVPHPAVGPHSGLESLPVERPHGSEALRVLLMGAVSPLKGSKIVAAVARLACERQAPIEFHWLGEIHHDIPTWPDSLLYLHGAYDPATVCSKVSVIRPHLAWMASPWPETFSYTLSELLATKLPIVATRLGAFEERLRNVKNAFLVEPDTGPDEILALLLKLRDDLVAGRIGLSERESEPDRGRLFYLDEYLKPGSKDLL